MDVLLNQLAENMSGNLNSLLTLGLCLVVWRIDRRLSLLTAQIRVLLGDAHVNILEKGD